MIRLARVAAAGALLLAPLGCSAAAGTAASTPAASATPSPEEIAVRQDVPVELRPARLTGGSVKSVRITARCPLPSGGTEYRAIVRSKAFTGLVSLLPPASTATAAVPELTGTALIKADAEPGRYRVEVRCEATNDTGTATLTILRPTPTPATTYPTKAPRAGGGGTAAGGPADGSGPGVVTTAAVLLGAAAIGVLAARRRSGA